MDVSAGTVTMLLALMLGILVLAVLIVLARAAWLRVTGRRSRSTTDGGPGGWFEEDLPAQVMDEGAEQLARWQALWAADQDVAARLPFGGATGKRARRPRARRLMIGAVAVLAAPLGYLSWVQFRPPGRTLDPQEAIVLASVDKWADAVSMFEDKLRIRFHYHNAGDRTVDAFNVYVRFEDATGQVVIQDFISVSNPVAPRQTSSWTQTYWATCEQGFSIDTWNALLQKDIGCYKIAWQPVGLVFDNGEGAASLPRIRCGVETDTMARDRAVEELLGNEP